jgi:hypothetical protein
MTIATLSNTSSTINAEALAHIPAEVMALCHVTGQFVTLQTNRAMKVRKGQLPINKVATYTVRVGVDHEAQARVVEKREEGHEAGELSGRAWAIFPYILLTSKGNALFRCYPPSAEVGSGVRSVKYMRGMVEITREEAQAACLASEFREREESPTAFDVNVQNITHINGNKILPFVA